MQIREVDVKLALGELTISQAADYLALAVPMDRKTADTDAADYVAAPGLGIAYEIGKVPAARCNASNVASRETMQKAGLLTINAWAIDGFTKIFWRDEPISHLWPQVLVLVTIAIALFQGQHATSWGLVFAASAIAVVPVILIFAVFQRQFVSGLSTGALKG